MHHTNRAFHAHTCTCGCPAHRDHARTAYNDPACHCLITCASQPTTLLTPRINGAFFLDTSGTPWWVPGMEPGHWDWRCATPADAGHPLSPAIELIADLLNEIDANVHLLSFSL